MMSFVTIKHMKFKIHVLFLTVVILGGSWWYYNGGVETLGNQAQEETTDSIKGQLEGTWQSTQDRQAGKIFTANTVVDTYEGEDMSDPSNWKLYMPSRAQDSEVTNIIEGATAYIIVEVGAEQFQYAVLELTEDTLVLNYLARGNTLEYQRVESE